MYRLTAFQLSTKSTTTSLAFIFSNWRLFFFQLQMMYEWYVWVYDIFFINFFVASATINFMATQTTENLYSVYSCTLLWNAIFKRKIFSGRRVSHFNLVYMYMYLEYMMVSAVYLYKYNVVGRRIWHMRPSYRIIYNNNNLIMNTIYMPRETWFNFRVFPNALVYFPYSLENNN